MAKIQDKLENCTICGKKAKLRLMRIGNDDVKDEDCIEMLKKCFHIKFPEKNQFGELNKTCLHCVNRLKESWQFRKQTVTALERFQQNIAEELDMPPEIKIFPFGKLFEPVSELPADLNKLEKEEIYIVDATEEGDVYENWFMKNKTEDGCDEFKLKDYLNKRDDCDTIMIIENHIPDDMMTSDVKIEEEKKTEFDDSSMSVKTIENDHFSDCSANTDEIYNATGYDRQLRKPKTNNFEIKRPKLVRGSLICPVCNEHFLNFNLMHKHFVTHFPIKLCHICGKAMASKSGYINHMRTHRPKTEEFVCKPCNKVFKTKHIMVRHFRYTHEGRKALKCYHCPQQFASSVARSMHLYKIHNVECKFYHCTQCDRKFFAKSLLSYHVNRIHNRKFTHTCDICDRGYMTKSELKDHINYKHGDKSELPQCEICGRISSSRKGLITHMKIHTDIRNFKCALCEKSFVFKKNLINHIVKHDKINTFPIISC